MKLIVAIFAISTSITTYAQLDIISTTFWNNYAHVNPAMSALEYKKHGSFMYRNDRYSDVANYKSLLANYNFLLGEKHGLGINYGFNETAALKEHDFNLNYNYQLKFEKERTLSIGGGLGVYTNALDPNYIAEIGAADSTLVIADKMKLLNASAGLAYNSEKLMLGVGAENLLEDALTSQKGDDIIYFPRRTMYLNGHYKITLGKKKGLEIRPQFIMRTDFSFTSTDLNILATFRNKYWAGFTYRNNDAYAIMFGWDIKEKLRVGYSIDVVQNKLTSATQRAHEVNLGIFLR